MTTSVPTTRPPGKGWRPWIDEYGIQAKRPGDYVEVEVWREGWKDTHLQAPDASPMMNAYGLYWRPAGPELTDEQKFLRALLRLVGRL